ncbi:shikimate kinase, partial [Cupriavidus sp. 2MCAB6]
MQPYAIFLSGPIGAGKTTLGKALATELGGGFIDGDDHSDPDLPWY